MNFKPNPLLYGANDDFYSSFKLAVTMCDAINHAALSRAVELAMPRYPYFCVYPKREENNIILAFNPRPVPVFDDGRCAILGGEECNGHLLFFGCEGNKIFLNASHYIADGMGIDPLLKTVLYLYSKEVYGTDGLSVCRIHTPSEVAENDEYSYPFPAAPFETDQNWPYPKTPHKVYGLDSNAFEDGGLYAYHLHVPQRDMMSKANPSDGSPVSFITAMMYQAFCALDASVELPVVAHVQHQYRQVLKTPINRHSLVSYISAYLPPKAKNWNTERQNTVLRGQIIMGSEPTSDLRAVNRIVSLFSEDSNLNLEEKKSAMRRYVDDSIKGKTFGISYVGKMDWCGLDRYVKDIHAYIGEKHTKNMMLIEVMTIGDDFTINLMQSGKGRTYLDAFINQLRLMDIPVTLVGEEPYTLCDTVIPN